MTEAARLLRYARKRAGLTQRALAAKTGVPQSYVARVESSRVDPAVSSLSRQLRACEMTLEAMPGTADGAGAFFALGKAPAERVAEAVGSPDLRPVPLLRALRHGDVRFVLVGGLAMAVHGLAVSTADADVCADPADENLRALASVLEALGATERGEEGHPSVAGLRGPFVKTTTMYGRLDVLNPPRGVRDYADLASASLELDLGGGPVVVAGLDDLIRMTRAVRPKDPRRLPLLVALRDEVARAS